MYEVFKKTRRYQNFQMWGRLTFNPPLLVVHCSEGNRQKLPETPAYFDTRLDCSYPQQKYHYISDVMQRISQLNQNYFSIKTSVRRTWKCRPSVPSRRYDIAACKNNKKHHVSKTGANHLFWFLSKYMKSMQKFLQVTVYWHTVTYPMLWRTSFNCDTVKP